MNSVSADLSDFNLTLTVLWGGDRNQTSFAIPKSFSSTLEM